MADKDQDTRPKHAPASVLVVDDEVDLADQIARHLKFLGYEVDTANSAEEALKKQSCNDYRVLITDIMMPGMHGDELLREIKERDGTIQVIVMSGQVRMTRLLRCLRLGACDCFAKPLNVDELCAAVDSAAKRIDRWAAMMKQFRTGVQV